MIKHDKGFTLIELLIVVAIMAILATAVFVVLNPTVRFQDSRDATRAANVTQIMSAIKLHQLDNNGTIMSEISSLDGGDVYMIVDGEGGGAMDSGGDDNNSDCDTNVSSNSEDVVDLDRLVEEGYLGDIPISPTGEVTWDNGSSNGDEGTGYTLEYDDDTGVVTIRACESENTTEIELSR